MFSPFLPPFTLFRCWVFLAAVSWSFIGILTQADYSYATTTAQAQPFPALHTHALIGNFFALVLQRGLVDRSQLS
jgi:hypothetical protein